MKITVITLFPNLFTAFLSTSIVGRAQKNKLIEFETVDLRQFGIGLHQVVDGRPFGGGAGMILRADVLSKALHSVLEKNNQKGQQKVVLLSASGTTFTQKKARDLSKLNHLILISGHYEGVDQRFIDEFVDEEISIGDYVLTGGELPSLVIIDAITRLMPNVLKKEEATLEESFEDGTLEHPQYTKPRVFNNRTVPEILVSGNHGKIKDWKKTASLEKTKKIRPDLLKKQ